MYAVRDTWRSVNVFQGDKARNYGVKTTASITNTKYTAGTTKTFPRVGLSHFSRQETSCSAKEEKILLCNVQSQTRSIQNHDRRLMWCVTTASLAKQIKLLSLLKAKFLLSSAHDWTRRGRREAGRYRALNSTQTSLVPHILSNSVCNNTGTTHWPFNTRTQLSVNQVSLKHCLKTIV